MASTRQEKLQMRQRGAATRKTKEVDFGFSFGLGPLGPELGGPSQHASQPADIVGEPLPPSNTPPANTQPLLPQNNELPVLSGRRTAQRTPDSAHNSRGEKRSIFDIPLDDEPPEERLSVKRRKIESPRRALEISSGQDGAIIQFDPVAQKRLPDVPLEVDNGDNNGLLGRGTPRPDNSVQPEEVDGGASPENAQRQLATNGKRKRAASDDRLSSERGGAPEGAVVTAEESEEPSQPEATKGAPLQKIGELQVSGQKRAKKPRGRPSKSARETPDEVREAVERHITQPGDVTAESNSRTSPADVGDGQGLSERQRGKRSRGRPSTSARASDTSKAPEESDGTSAEGARGHSRDRQRRLDKGSNDGELSTKGKHAKPKDASNSENIPQREQKGKKKRGTSEGRRRVSPQASHPEHESPAVPEPTAPEPPAVRKRRGRGRPSKNGGTATQLESERAASPADGDDTTRPKRKTRARGDTVPVTVHRLTNVASLTGVPESDHSSSGEDSADELSARQRTKLTNRGGVNPADVLSQVCRETLDKTLTTLRNAISNETNTARRAEHVRKTKAIEAYGAELEGRLFDLSEILDSNFVLGVQAKKAKREMMDLRSRLYHIRKERQEVAMQMDAVRRKYAEENSARMSRSTINNTLHSLELAVDRRQGRSAATGDSGDRSEDSVTAGLELKLRTMAQRVSSIAPGAHGGLLNQIKAFNKRLEAAAKKLEC